MINLGCNGQLKLQLFTNFLKNYSKICHMELYIIHKKDEIYIIGLLNFISHLF